MADDTTDLLDGACVDVLPEADGDIEVESDVPEGALGLALPTSKLWDCGRVLDFHFLGGTPEQQQRLREDASQWTKYANLLMRFDAPAETAEFRVDFKQLGNWSLVGTDNLLRPWPAQTMNVWNLSSILHEVGHAIGCIHEHSSPGSAIEWNKPVVYQALGGPPNNWDKATVDHNVFAKYDADQTQFSQFDPLSIMLYFFPVEWTLNGVATQSNKALSPTDQEFIRRCYPGCTVDFSKSQIATGACTVETGPRTMFNRYYGNSWIMNRPGGSFIQVDFHQPKQYAGEDIYTTAKLKLEHLTSMLYRQPGHSPIDITVNDETIKTDYSPPSGTYTTDEFDITELMRDGHNVVRLDFKRARSNYWIRTLQVDCERAFD